MSIRLHPAVLTLAFTFALAACGAGDEGGEAATSMDMATPSAESAPASAPGRGSDGTLQRGYERRSAPGIIGQNAAPAEPAPRMMAPTAPASANAVDQMSYAQPAAVTLNPMLIRTGTATVQVDSLELGIQRLRQLAARVGGIVGNTVITAGTEEVRQATVELRIPGTRFDEAVNGLSPIGKVESANVTAEDVGEEFTDITARVANARRLEARLLELLDTRNGRLEEVLNMEREVARVREEIERMEGRLRYLQTRAAVSTLTVTLHEPQTVIGTPGERPIRDAFVSAWLNFIGLVAGLISMLGWLIPLSIALFFAWRGWKWIRRREQERDAEYREAIRRERLKTPAPEEPAIHP